MPKAAALNMGMALVYLLVKPSLYHPNSWNNLLVLASPVWFSVLREFEYGIKKATDFSVEKRGKPGPTCVPRANLPEKTTGFFLGRSHMEIVLRPVIKNTGVTPYMMSQHRSAVGAWTVLVLSSIIRTKRENYLHPTTYEVRFWAPLKQSHAHARVTHSIMLCCNSGKLSIPPWMWWIFLASSDDQWQGGCQIKW